jgi:hypothetical protein
VVAGFSAVGFLSANLTEHEEGYPRAPNLMFRKLLLHLWDSADALMLLEPDLLVRTRLSNARLRT